MASPVQQIWDRVTLQRLRDIPVVIKTVRGRVSLNVFVFYRADMRNVMNKPYVLQSFFWWEFGWKIFWKIKTENSHILCSDVLPLSMPHPQCLPKKKFTSTTDNLIKHLFLCLFQYILQTMNWTLLPLQIKFCSRGFSTSETQQRQTLIVKRTQKLRYNFMICHMWKKLVISAAVFLILYEMWLRLSS